MRVRGLKQKRRERLILSMTTSHPMRVRGLKQELPDFVSRPELSHPMRVRGLKLER